MTGNDSFYAGNDSFGSGKWMIYFGDDSLNSGDELFIPEMNHLIELP